MTQQQAPTPSDAPRAGADEGPFHRSGAVARLLRMPVATLRVWERRYSLTGPALSPGGQRLYSAADVRRLALVKQLNEQGHAIGSLAALGMPQLQRVALMRAEALAATPQTAGTVAGAGAGLAVSASPATLARPWRLALVGMALGSRLRRPALLRHLAHPVVLLGPYDNAAQAAAAQRSGPVDAVLFYEPQLHDGWLAHLAHLTATAPALVGVPKAVLYGFAADSVCEALAAAGVNLLREPQPDTVVAQWLRGLLLASAAAQRAATPAVDAAVAVAAAFAPLTGREPVPARRWSDAALVEMLEMMETLGTVNTLGTRGTAGLAGAGSPSFTVACGCPRHVVELLVQLAHFETYSAECAHRNPADATLHAHLNHVAAQARAQFESALEQVALHEGLVLP